MVARAVTGIGENADGGEVWRRPRIPGGHINKEGIVIPTQRLTGYRAGSASRISPLAVLFCKFVPSDGKMRRIARVPYQYARWPDQRRLASSVQHNASRTAVFGRQQAMPDTHHRRF